MLIRFAAACVAATMLAGCSSIKTYPNTLAKNMHVSSKLDSGTVFSKSTEAVLDIFTVDAKCETTHEGRVELTEAKAEVGLPTNTPLYLEFVFVNSRRFVNQVSATRSGFLLTPRPGAHYQVKAQYTGGIYDVVVRETSKGDSSGRPLNLVPLSSCQAKG